MMCINYCDDPETMVIKLLLLLLLFTIVLMSCIRKGKTERVQLNSGTTRRLRFIITCTSDDKEEKEDNGKPQRQRRRGVEGVEAYDDGDNHDDDVWVK